MQNLPDLPKKNKKREADFGLKFRTWIENNPWACSCTFELKDTRGKDYFNIKELTEDQRNSALRTKSKKGNLIRIISGTPGAADYAFYANSPAFIVVKYPKFFCFIDIDILIREEKSVTSNRALEIATLII